MSRRAGVARAAAESPSASPRLLGIDFSSVLNALAAEPSAVFIYPTLLVLVALPTVLAEVATEFATYIKFVDVYRAMAIAAFVPAGLVFYKRRNVTIESMTLALLAYSFFVLLFPTRYAVAFIYGCMIVYCYICVQGNTRFVIIIMLVLVWWSERFQLSQDGKLEGRHHIQRKKELRGLLRFCFRKSLPLSMSHPAKIKSSKALLTTVIKDFKLFTPCPREPYLTNAYLLLLTIRESLGKKKKKKKKKRTLLVGTCYLDRVRHQVINGNFRMAQ